MTDHGLRYFEDYLPGATYDCGSVSVDQAEIISFAKAFDPQPFHVDPEAAASGPYGGLIRWPSPVRPGDTLRVRATVIEARKSLSKPDRGIVRTMAEAVNQDDRPVMRATSINFFRVRPGPGA